MEIIAPARVWTALCIYFMFITEWEFTFDPGPGKGNIDFVKHIMSSVLHPIFVFSMSRRESIAAVMFAQIQPCLVKSTIVNNESEWIDTGNGDIA